MSYSCFQYCLALAELMWSFCKVYEFDYRLQELKRRSYNQTMIKKSDIFRVLVYALLQVILFFTTIASGVAIAFLLAVVTN